MSQHEIESRLQALEQELAALKSRLAAPPSDTEWYREPSSDDPDLEEACRSSAEWRKLQPMVFDEDGA